VKRLLDITEDVDFSLLGISSHVKDYRLCWEINNALSIDLVKEDSILENKGEEEINFSVSRFLDEENHLTFELIANKSEGNVLLHELAQLDYLLKVSGPQNELDIADYRNKIQNIDHVLTVVNINPNELKSKFSLMF
jgi:hypothetical protein